MGDIVIVVVVVRKRMMTWSDSSSSLKCVIGWNRCLSACSCISLLFPLISICLSPRPTHRWRHPSIHPFINLSIDAYISFLPSIHLISSFLPSFLLLLSSLFSLLSSLVDIHRIGPWSWQHEQLCPSRHDTRVSCMQLRHAVGAVSKQ